MDHHGLGQWPQAEQLYREFLRQYPSDLDANHLLGQLYLHSGNFSAAREQLQRAVQFGPAIGLFHNSLGDAHRELGEWPQAEACYRRALELDPGLGEAHGKLGIVFQRQNRWDDAIACYERALAIHPADTIAAFNTGLVYRDLKRLDDAQHWLQQSVRLAPAMAEAWMWLGVTLMDLRQWPAAQRALQESIRLQPRSSEAIKQFGLLHGRQGRRDEAIKCLREAIALNPSDAEALNYLGIAYNTLDELQAARECFERAIAVRPEVGELHANLGLTLGDMGHVELAEAAYQRAFALGAADGARLRHAMLVPAIVSSTKAIDAIRSTVFERLKAIRNQPIAIADPVEEVCKVLFFTAYHGRNDRDLQAELAATLLHVCPSLAYTAPHAERRQNGSAGDKIRVGFVSRYFFHHSVGLHFGELIRRVPRDRLHVSVVRFSEDEDATARAIRAAADATIVAPTRLAEARQRIADERFDVLCYTDLGMDPLTYFLAFARLAPRQCVMPGHPVTTGIATIDDYLTCADQEPSDAESHYTERLVRFSHLTSSFAAPRPSSPGKDRRAFDLPEGVPLYVCPQMPFKIHPEFDLLAGEILQSDPRGRLVLFHDRRQVWSPRLLERLRLQIPDVADRILMLPRLAPDDFYQVLLLADSVLDSVHFTGGTTTFQALSLGVPVITLPGQFMRGRVTLGCYRRMGILNTVARNRDDYVQLAVRMANDRAWREQLRHELLAARGAISDNDGFARELAEYFVRSFEERDA